MDVSDIKIRRQVTSDQVVILLEFLKEHPDLAKGVNRGGRRQFDTTMLWSQCAKKLNSVQNGAVKDRKGWSKYWCDWKYRIKRRYLEQKADKDNDRPLADDITVLSSVEEIVLSIISDGSMDDAIIKTEPLELLDEYENDQESDNDAEMDSGNNDTKLTSGSLKRNHSFKDSDVENTGERSSKCARNGMDSNVESDNSEVDDASRFINLEEQKLEHAKNIGNSLQTIASELRRLTDIISVIKDEIVKKK